VTSFVYDIRELETAGLTVSDVTTMSLCDCFVFSCRWTTAIIRVKSVACLTPQLQSASAMASGDDDDDDDDDGQVNFC